MFGRILKSFVYAFRGLKTVWREEHNFRLEAVSAVIVLALVYFYRFSYIETISVVIAVVLVLSAEILNTAVEDLCNKIEPNQDNAIGKIKDVVAAFVLVAVIGAIFLVVMTFANHFGSSDISGISGVCIPSAV